MTTKIWNNKKNIADYWENSQPGAWWCDEIEGRREFFEKIEKQRYSVQPHIKDCAEFDKHPDEKVLEIGCGICTDLLQFARGHAQVVGLDLTNKALSLGKKRFDLYGVEGEWLKMDAENLGFKDNSFDYVYSFGVLHHTPNTQNAIDEVYRVLKKGGQHNNNAIC